MSSFTAPVSYKRVGITEPLTWKIDNRFQISGQFKLSYEGAIQTCYLNDIRDIRLACTLEVDDMVNVDGILTTRMGTTDNKFKFFIRNIKPTLVRASAFPSYYPEDSEIHGIKYSYLEKAVEEYAVLASKKIVKESLPDLSSLKKEFQRYHVDIMKLKKPFNEVSLPYKVPDIAPEIVVTNKVKEAVENGEAFENEKNFIKCMQEEHKRRRGL